MAKPASLPQAADLQQLKGHFHDGKASKERIFELLCFREASAAQLAEAGAWIGLHIVAASASPAWLPEAQRPCRPHDLNLACDFLGCRGAPERSSRSHSPRRRVQPNQAPSLFRMLNVGADRGGGGVRRTSRNGSVRSRKRRWNRYSKMRLWKTLPSAAIHNRKAAKSVCH